MRKIGKLVTLPISEKKLLLQALGWVILFRTVLWLLPFRTIRSYVARSVKEKQLQGPVPNYSPERIAWAVTHTSRFIPMATCLTQALSTQMLLSANGHPSDLRIGVARGQQGEFMAHAWIESNGRVVIGGSTNLLRFTPLPAIEVEGI